jgi:hypothetical protein
VFYTFKHFGVQKKPKCKKNEKMGNSCKKLWFNKRLNDNGMRQFSKFEMKKFPSKKIYFFGHTLFHKNQKNLVFSSKSILNFLTSYQKIEFKKKKGNLAVSIFFRESSKRRQNKNLYRLFQKNFIWTWFFSKIKNRIKK